LNYLHLDLNHQEGIKPSVEEFQSKEKMLDVLWNNAGVMWPPQGSKTKQGYEMQLGTNCIGPFLFTKLLTPLLRSTAKKEAEGSVIIVWVSSSAAHLAAPTYGVDMNNLDYVKGKSPSAKYAVSKSGDILYGLEFQKRYREKGVACVVCGSSSFMTIETDVYDSRSTRGICNQNSNDIPLRWRCSSLSSPCTRLLTARAWSSSLAWRLMC
jgi:NAD(P)-dependent dehydrogenase (short-subunit alcohol dehydrogenase family)